MAHIKYLVFGMIAASATADFAAPINAGYGPPSGGDFGGYSNGGGYSGGSGYSGGNDYGHSGGGGGYEGHEEHHEAKPYEFGYSVKDHHHGTDFGQQESSDGHNVKGQYRVALPDGRVQIVTYHADWKTGFHADVKYEGEAHYPEPNHGYGAGNGQGNSGYQYPSPHSDYTQAEFGHSAGGYRR